MDTDDNIESTLTLRIIYVFVVTVDMINHRVDTVCFDFESTSPSRDPWESHEEIGVRNRFNWHDPKVLLVHQR